MRGLHIHQPRDGVVGAIFLARQRIDRKLQRLGAGVAGIEERVSFCVMPSRGKSDLPRRENLVAVAHGQHRFLPRVAALVKT